MPLVKNNIKTKMNNPSIVADLFINILAAENEVDQDKEHFWAIGLDNGQRVKYIELVSLGILTEALVHPREVFRMAVMKAVKGIVICHNHPSGVAKPSPADKKVTNRIKQAGSIMDIPVYDHLIIISKGEYYSFRENGLI
jgi:DNA repair protein RadC